MSSQREALKVEVQEFEPVFHCQHCRDGRHDLCAGRRCVCASQDFLKVQHAGHDVCQGRTVCRCGLREVR